MPRPEPTHLAARLRRLAAPGAEALTDAELVGRYAEHRDAAAFEVLVWRHGAMVWATCRRILRHEHDAEDAFQAAFLALARAAGSIGTRRAVAAWLHRVAVNCALKLKAKRPAAGLTDEVPARPQGGPEGVEFAAAVDEELDRLPARCRAAFVLCCLEGMTSAEAARELGCPAGTVDSRLHAARARLRERLSRRGFGPGELAGLAAAAAPPAASLAAAVRAGSGALLRPAVDTLAKEVVRIMTTGVMTMKAVTAAVMAVAFGGAVWAFGGPGDDPPPAPERPVLPVKPPPAAPGAAKAEPVRPRPPGGILGDHLGVYMTIEGVRFEGRGKVETGTLLVDTVNGKKLEKPVALQVRGLDYPAMTMGPLDLPAGRCVLKGYESGQMIGFPGAVLLAAKERGVKITNRSQAAWQWRPYFVALIAVEPEGLEIPWGRNDDRRTPPEAPRVPPPPAEPAGSAHSPFGELDP
ncbi:MAG TPA: sigma-70 family RNA polymerase sigma factor [Gemmataceae bacterium]